MITPKEALEKARVTLRYYPGDSNPEGDKEVDEAYIAVESAIPLAELHGQAVELLTQVPIQPDGEPVPVQGVLSLSVAALRTEGHKTLACELEAIKDEQNALLAQLEALK